MYRITITKQVTGEVDQLPLVTVQSKQAALEK